MSGEERARTALDGWGVKGCWRALPLCEGLGERGENWGRRCAPEGNVQCVTGELAFGAGQTARLCVHAARL